MLDRVVSKQNMSDSCTVFRYILSSPGPLNGWQPMLTPADWEVQLETKLTPFFPESPARNKWVCLNISTWPATWAFPWRLSETVHLELARAININLFVRVSKRHIFSANNPFILSLQIPRRLLLSWVHCEYTKSNNTVIIPEIYHESFH